MGRAARHINATVIMYADRVTAQMQAAIDETVRRRAKQAAYNQEHGITARTVQKRIRRGLDLELRARKTARTAVAAREAEQEYDRDELIEVLEAEMFEAAERLEFEQAAAVRDQIAELKQMPDYGTECKLTKSALQSPKAKAGMARSRAGITRKGSKKKARGR